MLEISDAINWKFKGAGAMSTDGGVITQFPPGIEGVNYDQNGLPLQADQDAWLAEYKAYKAVMDTKAEARKRIIAIIPEWKQSNLNARMNELNKKVAIDSGTLTTEEQAEVTAMEAIWAQAKAIRVNSDALELSIAGMTEEQLDALDITDNSHWV